MSGNEWTKQPVHLKSSDGLEIFTDSKNVMARWSEYFQKLLNVPGDIEPEVLENIRKRSVNTALDEKPTMIEMVRAINELNDGKASGGDGIPAEVWKYGGANLSNRQRLGEGNSEIKPHSPPWKARPRSPKNRVTSIIRFKILYHFSDSTLICISRRFSIPSCKERRLSNSRQAR